MTVRDLEDIEHAARIEGGIIVIDGCLMSPEEFLLTDLSIISCTPAEERELVRWGMIRVQHSPRI